VDDKPDWLKTSVGATDADHIWVAGRDLPSEVMGRLSLTELAYLLLVGRQPTAGERRVVDTVLVSLADHGITPSSLATRLTYTGAPESIQGAIAAGLLGAGSVFLGPAGDTAIVVAEAVTAAGLTKDDSDERFADSATRVVAARRVNGERMPGLGHPIHRDQDPRTPRLYEIAAEEGQLGPHLRLLSAIAVAHEAATGKHLPVNGAGAAGAALVDVGIAAAVVRGFVLIARTAGLVAHLAEEMQSPIGKPLWLETERRASSHE
jgi:citrate synthase